MKTLTQLFPSASKSTVAANPQLLASNGGSVNKKRGVMNKTEKEYAFILEMQKIRGEILRYEYEGITLRWAGIRYTPDFVVFQSLYVGNVNSSPQGQIVKLIEVKGPWIKGKYERAVERFRHARTYWPEFGFELWQKTKEGWIRKQ